MKKAMFLACLLALPAAALAQTKTILWRTPVNAAGICGLSGSRISLPDGSDTAVRAWAGIVTDTSGGPAAAELRLRHLEQLAEQFSVWKRELSDNDAAEEINSRILHAGPFEPAYFDVVVAQPPDARALQWFIDSNLDGILELRGTVTWDSTDDSDSESPEHWLRMSLVTGSEPAHVVNPGAPELPEPTDVGERPDSKPVLQQTSAQRLNSQLLRLDQPSIRKQHLSEIVDIADELILELERKYGADSVELAEPLYRKGRALGYRELPDVVARIPIENPTRLNQDFESSFERLRGLVDVTQPKYVLLAIRRERRRGNRGAALDLLDIYREKHPRPDWYHKKRADLLRELKLPLLAHQAAADLWLHGTRPTRPVPVVFRMDGGNAIMTLNVDWMPAEPWRSENLLLRRVSPSVTEGVAWLPIHSTHRVKLTPKYSHEFQTDAGLVQSGSIVSLQPLGQADE